MWIKNSLIPQSTCTGACFRDHDQKHVWASVIVVTKRRLSSLLLVTTCNLQFFSELQSTLVNTRSAGLTQLSRINRNVVVIVGQYFLTKPYAQTNVSCSTCEGICMLNV